MTIIYLVRHAVHSLLGHELVGRRPGVVLSEAGEAQAARLATALAAAPIAAVLSSPQARTRQTAEAIARRRRLPVTVEPALDEVDFGDWTGLSFAELDRDPAWHHFNRNRASAAIPNGERILEVQVRMVDLIERLSAHHRDDCLALVSHGDTIRTALLHYLGMPLDFAHRLETSPASVSILALEGGAPRLLAFNVTVDAPHGLPATGGGGR